MPGYIKLEGDNRSIGLVLGQYWGNYFSGLNLSINHSSFHRKLYKKYRSWLKDHRLDLRLLQLKVEKTFPDLWEEIVGMFEGLQRTGVFDSQVTIGGLFSCVLAEADETACSTVVLRSDDRYTMIHSDEYDSTVPLIYSDVTLHHCEGEKRFFSLSHPFQLLGSAAGLNASFAFQGNSIGCKKKIASLSKNNIPKTMLSRKILEKNSVEEAADLYRKHACSLPNHHLFITNEGVFSLKVKLGLSGGSSNNVDLSKIMIEVGETFCHTNHFFEEDQKKSVWVYEDGQESQRRLRILQQSMDGVLDKNVLEEKFHNFLRSYPEDLRCKRLINQTSGIFCFQICHSGPPFVKSITFPYSWPI